MKVIKRLICQFVTLFIHVTIFSVFVPSLLVLSKKSSNFEISFRKCSIKFLQFCTYLRDPILAEDTEPVARLRLKALQVKLCQIFHYINVVYNSIIMCEKILTAVSVNKRLENRNRGAKSKVKSKRKKIIVDVVLILQYFDWLWLCYEVGVKVERGISSCCFCYLNPDEGGGYGLRGRTVADARAAVDALNPSSTGNFSKRRILSLRSRILADRVVLLR